MCSNKNQKGISIYLAVMAMSLILGVALGINALLQSQIRASKDLGYSVFALDAADAGLEKIFYDDRKNGDNGAFIISQCPSSGNPPPACTATLSNGAIYRIWVQTPGPLCTGSTYCAKSEGEYSNTKRTLRIAR